MIRLIQKQHSYTLQVLHAKKLKEALGLIGRIIEQHNLVQLNDKLNEINTNYNYLLAYMKAGQPDPDRINLYHGFLKQAYLLADDVKKEALAPNSTNLYYQTKRSIKEPLMPSVSNYMDRIELLTGQLVFQQLDVSSKPTEQSTLTTQKEIERLMIAIFQAIWVSDPLCTAEFASLKKGIEQGQLDRDQLGLLTSALLISSMDFFDIQKLRLLFIAYNHPHPIVNQRALVGIIILLFTYPNRVALYPDIAAQLSILAEDKNFLTKLQTLFTQLIKCRETPEITRKMRDEVIPQMIKTTSILKSKLDFDLKEDQKTDEQNPDWEAIVEESGMTNTFKEMSELQMGGSDVFMVTFAQLKNYPFFTKISNWFLPFDLQHSEIRPTFNELASFNLPLTESMTQSGVLCNSDKYSFCLTLQLIPEGQRNTLTQQFDAQNEAMNQESASQSLQKFNQQPTSISNQYIHDLYRFYKLFPQRKEFYDIFKHSYNPLDNPLFSFMEADLEGLFKIGDFLFHKAYYGEARGVFERLEELNYTNVQMLQKIGFCYQKEQEYQKAIKRYRHADSIKADSLWINRQLAFCYRQLSEHEKELEYYQKMVEVQPENSKLILQMARCLVALDRIEEALNCYFQLDLQDGNNANVWRSIVWCLFLVGKHKQALKYSDQVMEVAPKFIDLLNRGHILWALKRSEEALLVYEHSVSLSPTTEDFVTHFENDIKDLVTQGIEEAEIPLMLDLILSQNTPQ